MQVNRIILRNFCRVAELDYVLCNKSEAEMVGVYGPNGVGKSTCFNFAVSGCLTNNFSSHPDGKTGVIKQGSEGPSYAELHCSVNDTEFIIRRTFRGSGDASKLTVIRNGHEQVIAKAKQIEEWIESNTGLTPQIMTNFLFIPQDRIYGFLQVDKAERERMFAHLCGTTSVERLHGTLGMTISEQKAVIEAADLKDVTTLREQLKDMFEQGQVKKALMEAAQKELAKIKCPDNVRELQTAYMRRKDIFQSKKDEGAAVDKLRVDRDALTQKVKDLEPKCLTAKNNHEASEKAASKASELLQRNKAVERSRQLYEKLQGKIAEAEKTLKFVKSTKPEVVEPLTDKAKKSIEAVKHRVTEIELTLRPLTDGTSTCPTCGADVKSWKFDPEVLKRELAEKRKVIEDARRHDAKLWQYDLDSRKYDTQLREALHDMDSLRKQIEQCESAFEDIDQADLDDAERVLSVAKADKAVYEEADRAFREAKIRLDDIKLNIKLGNDRIQQFSERIEALHKSVPVLKTLDKAGLDALLQKDALRKEKEYEISRLKSEREGLRTAYDNTQKVLRSVASSQELLSRRKSLVNLLSAAREITHRSRLPGVVHRNVMDGLVVRVNRELAKTFDADFRVEAAENLSFTAIFDDDTRIAAMGLSGGERVVLALSFLMSLHSMFAGNAGILIVDEPTDGLDSGNKLKIVEIFKKWKVRCKASNQQTVIISHDDELRPVFDRLIELQKTEERIYKA